ncbi:ISAzo13 family transposase [Rubinisphaera margarita]|uniref:ISAzo13 family transposase n=1 Tax=Rubinisphaera margarita TaxID=2909586 RepID=UPI001EE8A086|nr:ISAzo13 family transposase [Rubinisphaera margarita]MCG6157662.1 ISAzo13 family transposase [Rubinisphaera margarita]
MVADNTAGSPVDENLKWTHLPLTQIVQKLARRGIRVCRKTIRKILRSLGFRSRRLVKSVTLSPSRDRDAQFRKISRLSKKYRRRGDPVFSLDSKRKEQLGRIYREGMVWADGPAQVLDHALPAYVEGEVTPHGLYDPSRHLAHVHITTGSDTGEFAVESLRRFWHKHAAEDYGQANSMLLLCDCGGSNSFRSHAFKSHLGELAAELKMSIRVAHLPVYCSKYNPIERRVFAHVERSFRGRIFGDGASVAQAVRETELCEKSGLTITASVIDTEYVPVRQSRRKYDLSDLAITHDRHLPDYNYVIKPRTL